MTGTKALFALVTGLAVGVAALCQAGDPAFAQGGSTSGVIGKQNKGVSAEAPGDRGRDDTPVLHRRAAPAPRGCPSIVGVWDSWASGMFGKGDTTFHADGSAIHRSGIRGRWRCDNGRLFITWPDGNPGEVKVSEDGRSIINLVDGQVGMRR